MEPLPEKLKPVEVEYCHVCTLATEYCEYSPLHAPVKKVEEKTDKVESSDIKPADGTTPKDDVAKPPGPEGEKPAPEQPADKKEKKVKAKPAPKLKILLHEKKHRTLTQVSGLDTFELSGKDISKKLTKKFGCGSGSVTSDGFELQGAFKEPLIDFLLEEFPDKMAIKFIEVEEKLDKKKRKKKGPQADEDSEEDEPQDKHN